MTALSITASQVIGSTSASTKSGLAAAAITQGQTVYFTSSGTVALTDCDDSAAKICHGIALNAASAGQPVKVQLNATIIIGAAASVAQGTAYYAGPTAGSIVPEADILSGDNLIYLGIGDDADGIVLNIHNSGVVHV